MKYDRRKPDDMPNNKVTRLEEGPSRALFSVTSVARTIQLRAKDLDLYYRQATGQKGTWMITVYWHENPL